jgi:hypothetical protein
MMTVFTILLTYGIFFCVGRAIEERRSDARFKRGLEFYRNRDLWED